MQKQAPSITQLAIIAGFTLSCFGLLLFLWVSFGGPTPLKAQGYTFKVPFKEAGQLAEQSDVRISGVSVGKVTGIDLGSGEDAGSAVATVELNNTYAPVPENTRAILRQKTLLGETYVELSPGDRNDSNLPDGGELPRGPGGALGRAGRDLPHLQRQDPGRLPELDGRRRGRLQGAWPGTERRARPARADPHRRRQGRTGARHPAGRGAPVRPQHRRRAERAQRPPGAAPGPDPQQQRGLPDDRSPATRTCAPSSSSCRPSSTSRG